MRQLLEGFPHMLAHIRLVSVNADRRLIVKTAFPELDYHSCPFGSRLLLILSAAAAHRLGLFEPPPAVKYGYAVRSAYPC